MQDYVRFFGLKKKARIFKIFYFNIDSYLNLKEKMFLKKYVFKNLIQMH